jgi:hypothetical protein
LRFLKAGAAPVEKRRMSHLRAAAASLLLAPYLLGAVGCGKAKPAGNPDGGGGPNIPAAHGEPVRVAVLAPTPETEFTTLNAAIDLEGVALGGATAVKWSGPAGKGMADGTTSWRAAQIPLNPGENRIVLEGVPPAGSDAAVVKTTITVRRNAFLGLRSRPRLDPEAAFIGDTTSVIATVALDMTGDVDPASLVVSQSDAHGGWSMAAKMVDDGDFAHSGDEIPGDGIYAGRFNINKTQAGPLVLAVQGKNKSGAAQEIAAMGSVPFVSHLTATEYDSAAQLVNGMQHAQDEHKAEGLVASTNAALAVAAQDPNVAAAGISHEGSSVWVLTTAGVIGGTLSAHPDERGGVEVGNRAAFCGSPTAAALGDQDEAKAVAAMLGASACPAFEVGAFADEGVTLERLAAMRRAGVVVLATHGTTFDENSSGTPALDAHEFMLTGEVVTPEARAKYELNLKTQALGIGPAGADGKQRFLMSSKFIRTLGRFPGSIVYAGACRSFYAGEFATAFLEAGAGAYLGYTDVVKSAFAYQTGKAFFECLLTNKTTGECWDPTLDDGGSTEERGVKRDGDTIVAVTRKPAHLKMLGRTDLTLAATASGLTNAGFEETEDSGASSVAPRTWLRVGDARAMTALGGYVPAEGARMGLLSTGLGFTQTNGELQQTFCVPAGVKTLSYDWNFISDEFKSYCGDPEYQDNLRVTLQERGAAEPQVVQAVKIDDLCDTVGPSLFAVPDVNYMDMDGMSYATGWKRSAAFDVSAFAGSGKPVTLRFTLADKGDSIYDTVVLVDGLKLE